MAKTVPSRQKGGQSIHSRAARRATSPGINTDKSLKEIEAPQDYKPKVLAAQSAGVTKKKHGRKSVLSAKARKRHEKGQDRAEAVMDRKEKLIEKSRARARNTQDRAKNWEELNRKILMAEELEKGGNEKAENEDEDWEDEKEVDATTDDSIWTKMRDDTKGTSDDEDEVL